MYGGGKEKHGRTEKKKICMAEEKENTTGLRRRRVVWFRKRKTLQD